MSPFGDDVHEMPHRPIDDELIDAILAGTSGDEAAGLRTFVDDLRTAAVAVPTPSPALAAALARGFSTDKGDLPATAGSNVHGPATQVAGLPKWRNVKMKVQGFLAGLGLAGKVALGTGLAAAATTGAGAAGVLPEPVQHVVASAVDDVTPFEFPDRDRHTDHHDEGAGKGTTPDGGGPGRDDGGVGVIAPGTTQADNHEPEPTTVPTTAAPVAAPEPDGPKPTEPAPTTTPTTKYETPTTPTTKYEKPAPPQAIELHCTTALEPSRVSCQWSSFTAPNFLKYVLWRKTGPSGAPTKVLWSHDALSFVDTTVTLDTGYAYKVVAYATDYTPLAYSNIVTLSCCGV